MTLPAFKSVGDFDDPKIQKLEDNIDAALRRGLAVPFLDGVLLKGINVNASTPALVQHGLGRAWVGWWVVDKTAQVVVWRATNVALPSSVLPLNASGSATINLWVF